MTSPWPSALAGWARRVATVAPERPLVTAVVTLGLAVVSWPVALVPDPNSLDGSWEVALYVAVRQGLHFGSDVVFTYGPLGFVTIPWPWMGPMTVLALVLAAILQVAISYVAYRGARRVLAFVPAVVVAYIAVRAFTAFRPPETLLALTIVVAIVLLLRDDRPAEGLVAILVPMAAGFVAGLAVLTKVSDGAFVVVIAGAAAIGQSTRRIRATVVFLAAAAVAFGAAWLLTGQRLGDIVGYVRGSIEIVRGYSEAMAAPGTQNEWYIVAYLVGVAIVAWSVWSDARAQPRARQLALLVVGAAGAFAFFKVGVVRWGVGYALAAVLLAVMATARNRHGIPAFVLSFAVLFLPLLAVSGEGPLGLLSPMRSLAWLKTEAGTAVRPWTWARADAATATSFRTTLGVDARLIAELRGQSVAIEPWAAGVIVGWPELTWRPLPVFQSYSAYTPYLDDLNATLLAGPDAPLRILRAARPSVTVDPVAGPPAIDHRNGWFDAPDAMLQTFCRYDEVDATSAWELLGLTSRTCGSPVPLDTVTARTGETVEVPVSPRPDEFVIVRILGLGSIRDAVLTALVKGPSWTITVDGDRTYRLVPGTAGDGLLLAVPDSIRRSPAFAFGPPRRSISVRPVEGGSASLTFEFLAVPLLGGT